MRVSMLRRFTLTSVLVSVFTLVGPVPLAVFGFYTIRVISDHLVQQTVEEQKQDVLTDAHQIQYQVDMAQGDLLALSHVTAMQELLQARVRRDPARIEQWRQALERVFLAFSTDRKVYS